MATRDKNKNRLVFGLNELARLSIFISSFICFYQFWKNCIHFVPSTFYSSFHLPPHLIHLKYYQSPKILCELFEVRSMEKYGINMLKAHIDSQFFTRFDNFSVLCSVG